jgi:hypothetical protein
MDSPRNTDRCIDCRNLERNPTDAHAVKMAAHRFYACRLLNGGAFHGKLAVCKFTPSRFEPLTEENK